MNKLLLTLMIPCLLIGGIKNQSKIISAENEMVRRKDYRVIDFTNSRNATPVALETLRNDYFKNIINEPNPSCTNVTNCWWDLGGLRFGSAKSIGTLQIDNNLNQYEHAAITGFSYNQPIKINNEVTDWRCDNNAEVEYDLDGNIYNVTFPTNENQLTEPASVRTEVSFKRNERIGTCLTISNVNYTEGVDTDGNTIYTDVGRFVITKIELWKDFDTTLPVFQNSTWDEVNNCYKKTIETNIDNPLTLADITAQIKAIDPETNNNVEISLIENNKNYPNNLKPGNYPLIFKASSNGGEMILLVDVITKDTEAPKIIGPLEIKSGYSNPKTISQLLTNFTTTDNASDVTLSIKNDNYSTNKNKIGTYPLTIVATDSSGNQSTKDINVIVYDDQAPIIVAPTTILKSTTTILTTSDIIKYISAADEIDGNLPVVIKDDKYSGNGNKEGVYPITFVAKDKTGNGTTKVVNVEVSNAVKGNAYLIDNFKLVTFNNSLMSEEKIRSYIFASGLVIKTNDTYMTITLDTYSPSFDIKGNYEYEIKVRNSGGTEQIIALNIEVVDGESGTHIYEEAKGWLATAWQAFKDFWRKLWNWMTKGKWELPD